ncbi:MAG TPA: hypothetical protein VGM03_21740 [Phycisphaerae bacterium]|jgi:hypothetical protein
MYTIGLVFAKLFPAAVSVAAIDAAGYLNGIEFRSLLASFLSALLVAIGDLFLKMQGAA